MASPPEPAPVRLAGGLATLTGTMAALAVALIVCGLIVSWAHGLTPGVDPASVWAAPSDPAAHARYHAAVIARALLVLGEGVIVAAPLVGVGRLALAGWTQRRLALSAAGTLAVVLAGAFLAR